MALDQGVVNLAKAIRQVESGGRQVKGGSGEFGMYQWMPGTWKASAQKYLGSADAAMTPQNENKVAYMKIKEWKDSGYNVGQIASMWNSGSPDHYNDNWRGTNKAGVKYDTPAYAQKVAKEYRKLKGVTPTIQTSTPTPFINQQPLMQEAPQTSSPLLPGNTDTGNALEGLLGGINKAYQGFTQLPGIKQASELVGGVVGDASRFATTALSIPLEAFASGVKGLQTGTAEPAMDIVKRASETGKVGGEIMKEAGTAALPAYLTGYGGKLVQAPILAGMGYSGVKNVKEGLMEGSPEKALQGGLELGFTAFGVKHFPGNKGRIFNPDMTKPTKETIGRLTNLKWLKGASNTGTATPGGVEVPGAPSPTTGLKGLLNKRIQTQYVEQHPAVVKVSKSDVPSGRVEDIKAFEKEMLETERIHGVSLRVKKQGQDRCK